MSAIFRMAGGPPVATTPRASSGTRVAVRELPDEFLSQLVAIFFSVASIEFAWTDLPVQLRGLTANPPTIYGVSFAVIAPEILPHRAMGHRSRLRRVEGPPAEIAEAGGAGGRSRAEVRGGVQRARSSSRNAPTRKTGGELRAEIAVAAAATTEGKQARARSRASLLAEFKAVLAERESAFDRDAVAYFVFTYQAEYDGPVRTGGSDEGSGADDEGGSEEDVGNVGVSLNVTQAGELIDSSDEDGAEADCSSIGSFIDTGEASDDGASDAKGPSPRRSR